MNENPGDYYREKSEIANLLSEVLWRLYKLKQYEPHVADQYQKAMVFLEQRLEFARYVGD